MPKTLAEPPHLGVVTTLLCGWLLIVDPLRVAFVASSALSRLLQFGVPALLLLGYRVAVVGVGVAAGRAIRAGRAEGWPLAKLWALASAIAILLTFATPYFPSSRLPGTKGLELAGWLSFYGACYLYAWRKARSQSRSTAKETV